MANRREVAEVSFLEISIAMANRIEVAEVSFLETSIAIANRIEVAEAHSSYWYRINSLLQGNGSDAHTYLQSYVLQSWFEAAS